MLGDRMAGVPGSAVVPVLQGRRPLVVEVQALVGPGTAGGASRPHTLGLDAARANLLVAVLACRTAVAVPAGAEFFVAAVGGISVTEPAADLAVALALASVLTERALPPDLVAFGELGLAGEVRQVPGAERRLAEARRAGFTRALVPASTLTAGDGGTATPPAGLVVHGVRTLAEALAVAGSEAGTEAGTEAGPGTMPGWPTVPAAASR
jgi:DNA repair protein RadA/Sms